MVGVKNKQKKPLQIEKVNKECEGSGEYAMQEERERGFLIQQSNKWSLKGKLREPERVEGGGKDCAAKIRGRGE